MRIQKPNAAPMPGILGKVKVGEKATNQQGKEYPTSLDYFRFTSNEAHRLQRVADLYGEKPTKLPITFHCNDLNTVCSQRYEYRNKAGQLVADGDGKAFHQSTSQGMIEVAPANPESYMKEITAKNPGGAWKEVLILRFMLLSYPEYGLWEFRTSGKDTSIQQIISSFDTVMEQAGRVKGLPFWLTIQKHKSNRAEVSRQYPVVNLVCDLSPQMVEAVLSAGNQISGLVTQEKLTAALPEGRAEILTNGSAVSRPRVEIEEAHVIEDEPPVQPNTQKSATKRAKLERNSPKWRQGVDYLMTKDGTIEVMEKSYEVAPADKEYLQKLLWLKDEMISGNFGIEDVKAQVVDMDDMTYFLEIEKELVA